MSIFAQIKHKRTQCYGGLVVPCVKLHSDMCAFLYTFVGLGLLLLNALCSLLLV